MNDKPYDLILWGATGFTGRLVAEYLLKQYGIGKSLRWAIAARSEDKLKSTRQELGESGIPIIIADSHNPASLIAMVEQTCVVCTTVGPYALHGSLLVQTCVEQGVDYCDLTGEVPWIRRMIDQHHQTAASKGVKIVHCCGFDSIPSDLGVKFLQEYAYKTYGNYCQQIRLRVKAVKGGLSGGTYASLKNVLHEAHADHQVAALMDNPYSLNPLQMQQVKDQKDLKGIAFDKDFHSWTGPFAMAGINTRIVRRSHALAGFPYGNNFTYEEATLTGRGFSGKLKATLMAKVIEKMTQKHKSILLRIADYFLPDPGEGPSKTQRESGFFKMALTGELADGQSVGAIVTGDRDPGYGSTSKMLGESAVCLALDRDQLPLTYGVLTPAIAMDKVLRNRLQEHAGLKFKIAQRESI